MIKGKLVAAIAVLSVTAACGAVNEVRNIQPEGSEFSKALSMEYRDLALFESEQMFDHFDADHFARKGLSAAQGNNVLPSNPEEWDLQPEFQAEALDAYQRLMAALDGGARTGKPATAARAQVKFDCWVEQNEENFQDDHISTCRDDFFAALQQMEAPAPAPEPVAVQEPTPCGPITYICFFGFDSAEVDDECRGTLSLVKEEVDACEAGATVLAEGHTDTSGASAYNMALSLRRADNILTALENVGVSRSLVTANARGEESLRVPTADDVRERENRRVEITIQ